MRFLPLEIKWGAEAATLINAALNQLSSLVGGGGLSDGDKGDITVSSSGAVWEIDAGAVGSTELATDAVTTIKITDSNVTTAKIADDNVTNAKLANMAQATIKGRAVGAGTGDPTDLTATQATAILDNFVGDSGSGGTKGLVPAPASGDSTKFLKGDGTWAAAGGGGGGSGATILTLLPLSNEPPATNFATIDFRNQHPVLDFDASTQEAAIWTRVLPRSYAGGGITVYVHWAATTATTGNVGWDVAFERIGQAQQDTDSDGFASAQTITAAAVDATSGNVKITSVAVSDGANMDSIAAGEAFRIRIRRDVSAGSNAAGDAELFAVELKET